MKNIANTLKDLRLSHGYTMDELSKKVGVSKSAISMYENNKRVPPVEMLAKFSDIYGVNISYIVDQEEPDKRPGVTVSLSPASEYTIYRTIGKLNENGVRRLLEYLRFLNSSSEFTNRDEDSNPS